MGTQSTWGSFHTPSTMSQSRSAKELRTRSKEELLKQLDELKNELAQLRVAKVAGGTANKLSKLSVVRRSIARVLTVHNQMQKAALRKHFRGRKYKPLDLRPKKTRAIRRRLTKEQEKKITLRQRKKLIHFGQRKYALKV